MSAIEGAAERSRVTFDTVADVLPHVLLGRLLAQLQAARDANQPIAILHVLCHGTAAGQTFGLAFDEDSGAAFFFQDFLAGSLQFFNQVLAPFHLFVEGPQQHQPANDEAKPNRT